MRSSFFRLSIVAALAAACSSGTSKNACDTLKACNLSSSGFSCDNATTDCTNCIESTSCSDLAAAKCSTACPGTNFH